MPRIKVEAEIRPTEDEEKVRRAVLNVFDPLTMEIVEYGERRLLVAESHTYRSLRKLHNLLRRERILDAARKYLRRGTGGNLVIFKLNKQAAYMGHVSFVDADHESPLGAITFIIETSSPGELIDWLAPKTSRGKPLWERDVPRDTV